MAFLWLLSAMEALIVVVCVGIHFLTRVRGSEAADSIYMIGATMPEMNGNSGPSSSSSATTGAVHEREGSAEPGHEYEVFLSFRGKDIRKTFANCLYHGLDDAGINTFIDSKKLHVGKKIGAELMRAVRQTKISIPIFTENYASSKWCLMEVAEMVKCMNDTKNNHTIMPIFLDVTPNDVQHQTGTYAKPFAEHEKGKQPKHEWRTALQAVAELKGLELSKEANGLHGKFIKMVVAEVLRKLRKPCLNDDEIPVGLDDPAENVKKLLQVDSEGIQMVGICGFCGIGKTTLAKYVYYQIASDFECWSFLSDIRGTSESPQGLQHLQSRLASDILGDRSYNFSSTVEGIRILGSRLRAKRSLILLDDVNHIDQLRALAGESGWFGSGSRILVTTRDKQVLLQLQMLHPGKSVEIYEVKPLDKDQAFKLFCKHAFRGGLPPSNVADLSKEIVLRTGGHPLTLEDIGSHLSAYYEDKGVWLDTIEKLKLAPRDDVEKKLRICYDALGNSQKKIFLDVACLFIGMDYQNVIPMWTDCNFYPTSGVKELKSKSFIKIGMDNRLHMHNQLRDLGRHIVQQENDEEPALRSRLWRSKEALHVLRHAQGTSKIEAAVVWSEKEKVCLSEECFNNLRKLRILQLRDGATLAGDIQHLLPMLRWMSIKGTWHVGSSDNSRLDSLIVLDLSHSSIDEDWEGWRSIKMSRLKVLDLSWCNKLRRIPDFSVFPSLERLNLEDCQTLESIDPSIEHLKNLNYLNLRRCRMLKKLPNELGHLESLAVLIVEDTDIQQLPVSKKMKNLQILSADGCHGLETLLEFPPNLISLKVVCDSLQCEASPMAGAERHPIVSGPVNEEKKPHHQEACEMGQLHVVELGHLLCNV